MNFNKLLIQKRTKELLEKADKPKEFTKGLQEITKKNSNEVAKFLINLAKTNLNKDTKRIMKNGMKKLSNDKQETILNLLD